MITSDKALARLILDWLLRPGFDEWWYGIDEEIRQEITDDLAAALTEWRAET